MRRPGLAKRLFPAVLTSFLLSAAPASAANILVNGGFESGLSGWTTADQPFGDGSFSVQDGTLSPINLLPVPPPPEGSFAAMSDGMGPGSHILYQDVVIPASVSSATLSFSLFIQNLADDFYTPSPATLDWAIPALNQQVRVDLLLPGIDPFTTSVLANLFQTNPGDPAVSGYTAYSFDVTSLLALHAGQTVRLRFADVNNVFIQNAGVDAVALDVNSVPEPATVLLLGMGAGALAVRRRRRMAVSALVLGALVLAATAPPVTRADSIAAEVLDPNLQVTVFQNTGLSQPMGIVFLNGTNDYLVLEKASGLIKRVLGGVSQPVLDLAVNSASERGLLSVVLHPQFPVTPWVYVAWTESNTGADTNVLSQVALLNNRVDRFLWNGAVLSFDRNIIRLRSRQTDNVPVPGQEGTQNNNEQGNHNGGTMKFGPDGKLYIFMGDQGRRGALQNLAQGPFVKAPFVDDTFGGPMPDNAHLAGINLRLNDDGTTPADNPFFAAGAAIGGEVGANVQRIYSYGHRNGFGMDFDPYSGALWQTENADDAFSELNRVVPGMNGGWIQIAGPLSRMAQFKTIETTQFGSSLQQVRYPPTRIAFTASLALARMFMLPGATYVDPALSWKYEIGPSGASFVFGTALGPEYDGTLWIGSSRAFQQVGGTGGSLYRLRLTPDRLDVDVSADPRLADRVADNLFRAQKFEGTESESLLIGRGFGTTSAIEQGPDGNLYVVSLTDNTIYRISRRP